jgi:hypothetical protein
MTLFLAAGLPRSSRAAARQKKNDDSFVASSTVPTEVVTHLYHHGKLVKVIQLPKKSNNDVATKPTVARGDGLLNSDDDEYLNNVMKTNMMKTNMKRTTSHLSLKTMV